MFSGCQKRLLADYDFNEIFVFCLSGYGMLRRGECLKLDEISSAQLKTLS